MVSQGKSVLEEMTLQEGYIIVDRLSYGQRTDDDWT
jgi:hypothetical protein